MLRSKIIKLTFPLLVSLLAIYSCNNNKTQEVKEEVMVTQEDRDLLAQAQSLFKALPASAENPENTLTPEKIKLGKILYYDTRLSKTGNNSCNSCHNLATFGVDNLPTSKGDAGKFGDRNSPTVLNAAFHTSQFWDGRAKDLEEQAGGPILNPVEMDIPSKEFLVSKLKKVKLYEEMFKKAYPNDKDPLTYTNITKAIAAFERTLITPAPFDKYLAGDFSALDEDQLEGLKTFVEVGCTQCHSGALMGGNMFQKFGVYGDYRTFTKSKVNDEGRKKETGQEADKDMFKVPSLRNCVKTQPYFHDGSIADLNQAIIIMGKTQLNKEITQEQAELISDFLNTLSGDIPVDAKTPPSELGATM